MREDIFWLLDRIVEIKNRKWPTSKKYIFQGSYDVWFSEEDIPRYDAIMNHRLNETRDLGLIINETGNKEWQFSENWHLTELGQQQLQEELKCRACKK